MGTSNTARKFWVFTARKRSLEQGNIFTGLELSVHRGRGITDRDPPPERDPPWTKTLLYRDHLSLTETTPGQRPLTLTPPPPWTEIPLYGKERKVRILLEFLFLICLPITTKSYFLILVLSGPINFKMTV